MTTYSGINPEITDSYRRTLEFNNSLLIKEFDERYEFKTEEHIRKMARTSLLSRPWTEDEIQKYRDSQAKLKENRRQRYVVKLVTGVEPAVRQYAIGIRGFIGGS